MTEPTLLVTGGCGYLGAHLLREIAKDGHYENARVRVLDNLSSGTQTALMDLPKGPRYEFIEGDILAPAVAQHALDGVDVVLHLAALVGTPFAFDQPASIQQVNHWGTVRLLEHCREAGVRRFLYPSSVSVYGPGGVFSEAMECRPLGPYSRSKFAAESAVIAANSPDLATTVLRIATLYGGEPCIARFEAVANRLVYLAGTARSLTVFGSGEQQRPLVHANDAARALLYALESDTMAGETYNVVENNPSIESLARMVADLQPGARIRYTDQDYREHISLSVSGDKIHAAGWAPEERLVEGLKDLLGHFRGLSPLDTENLFYPT